jgi:[protein-PII] uridylyltransferase
VIPNASATATVLEVRAPDGPSLLYRTCTALGAAGARIQRARISTYGADAVDTFYLVDPEGHPLTAAATESAARSVESALRSPVPDPLTEDTAG